MILAVDLPRPSFFDAAGPRNPLPFPARRGNVGAGKKAQPLCHSLEKMHGHLGGRGSRPEIFHCPRCSYQRAATPLDPARVNLFSRDDACPLRRGGKEADRCACAVSSRRCLSRDQSVIGRCRRRGTNEILAFRPRRKETNGTDGQEFPDLSRATRRCGAGSPFILVSRRVLWLPTDHCCGSLLVDDRWDVALRPSCLVNSFDAGGRHTVSPADNNRRGTILHLLSQAATSSYSLEAPPSNHRDIIIIIIRRRKKGRIKNWYLDRSPPPPGWIFGSLFSALCVLNKYFRGMYPGCETFSIAILISNLDCPFDEYTSTSLMKRWEE